MFFDGYSLGCVGLRLGVGFCYFLVGFGNECLFGRRNWRSLVCFGIKDIKWEMGEIRKK